MSEEVQENQEQAPATEEQTETSNDNQEPAKKKKINRLTRSELDVKIEKMEKDNQTHSKYYKNLIERRNELDGYPKAEETPSEVQAS